MNDSWSPHFILKLGSIIPLKYVVTDTQFLSLENVVTFYVSECVRLHERVIGGQRALGSWTEVTGGCGLTGCWEPTLVLCQSLT